MKIYYIDGVNSANSDLLKSRMLIWGRFPYSSEMAMHLIHFYIVSKHFLLHLVSTTPLVLGLFQHHSPNGSVPGLTSSNFSCVVIFVKSIRGDPVVFLQSGHLASLLTPFSRLLRQAGDTVDLFYPRSTGGGGELKIYFDIKRLLVKLDLHW